MNTRAIPRAVPALLAVAGLSLALLLAGCGQGGDADPATPTGATAPTLPDASRLAVDLGFFADGAQLAKAAGHANFVNAYLRAVLVGAMTDLVLAPPVAAFALAVDTVPSRQDDGSWIWVYTFVDGDQEAQVRLRGAVDRDAQGDLVRWQMRVTLHDGHVDLDQALWFKGTTRRDGNEGQWTFHDLEQPSEPAAAILTWNHTAARHELHLEALQGADAGDALTFSVAGTEHRIDFSDGGADATWYVRWNTVDGTGSLQVPDYNGGAEACWDEQQYDVDCGA